MYIKTIMIENFRVRLKYSLVTLGLNKENVQKFLKRAI